VLVAVDGVGVGDAEGAGDGEAAGDGVGVATGVGEGDAADGGVGVGVGEIAGAATELAMLAVPPQPVKIKAVSAKRRSERKTRFAKIPPVFDPNAEIVRPNCTGSLNPLDYVECLRD
jgi:hypothetical protein